MKGLPEVALAKVSGTVRTSARKNHDRALSGTVRRKSKMSLIAKG